MTELEVSRLLTVASMIDNRTVAPEVVREWHRLMGHLDADIAREAMEMHFAESDKYLLPAHVLSNASRIRWSKNAPTLTAIVEGECPVDGHHGYPVPCAKCERETIDAVFSNQENGGNPF